MLDKKEKYIISISTGSMYYEEEFIGSIEEAKKETDHAASLIFYEDGDTAGGEAYLFWPTLLKVL